MASGFPTMIPALPSVIGPASEPIDCTKGMFAEYPSFAFSKPPATARLPGWPLDSMRIPPSLPVALKPLSSESICVECAFRLMVFGWARAPLAEIRRIRAWVSWSVALLMATNPWMSASCFHQAPSQTDDPDWDRLWDIGDSVNGYDKTRLREVSCIEILAIRCPPEA